MIDPNVSTSSPRDAQPTIGLIGMGAMGRMYAKYLSEAGRIESTSATFHLNMQIYYATMLPHRV